MRIKKTINMLAILTLLVSGVIMSACTSSDDAESSASGLTQPERVSEINGTVLGIEGNDVLVESRVRSGDEMTEEEQAIRKAERQSLTPEERQATKGMKEDVVTEKVSLTIPIGIKMAKGDGTATSLGSGANLVPAYLSEIKSGTGISIWLDGSGEVEFVKLKNLK